MDVNAHKRLVVETTGFYAQRGCDGVSLLFVARFAMEDGWIDRMARVASELFQQCRAPTQDAAEQLGQPAAALDKLNDTAA